jgi:antitoxin HigA-1
MIPKNRVSTHPGKLLLEEFLIPMGITQADFAKHIRVSWPTLNQLVNGRRGVSSDMAYRLASALGTTAEFWANAQMIHDLSKQKPVKNIKRLAAKTRVA